MKQIQVLQEASQVIFAHLGRLIDASALFLAENDRATNWVVSAWNRKDSRIAEGTSLPYEKSYCKLVIDANGPVS
ncbi:MAG TPA: hypothetical protein VEZ72_06335, partial [Paenibacillus sp.]|nr:hypothetical protein [Paenibacillus sp.]